MSQILWYGHSAFNISCDDKHVVVDPFLTPASGTTAETIGPVDVVLVTHDHADHVGDAVPTMAPSMAPVCPRPSCSTTSASTWAVPWPTRASNSP